MNQMLSREMRIALMGLAFALCAGSPAAQDALEIVESNRFVVNGGTVFDTQTSLRWQRCSVGLIWMKGKKCVGQIKKFDFIGARRMADLVVAGDVWRVPTKNELESIIDKSRLEFAIDRRIFPDVDEDNFLFWTIDMHDQSAPWAVEFKTGVAGYIFGDYSTMKNKWSVRLVRLDHD